MEPVQREAGSPLVSRSFTQVADDELAPGVAPVRRVVRRPLRLGPGRLPTQEGIALEPPRRLVHIESTGVYADGADQACDSYERLDVNPDRKPRVVGMEALFDG